MAKIENDIAFGNIANALKSVASDHVLGIASDIYDDVWEDYQSEINKALKDKLTSVENIPTLINGGIVNLSSTGNVETVYNSLKDNGVAICIIGDSNGNYPSTESRINVNEKYCAALSYFFSDDPRGASVGDLLLVSKQKVLGLNACALKIIPINDAKVAGDGYNGAEGIVTVGDKERINKIDGIEWTANNVRDNYLPKSDFLPTRNGENMNECLETGVYVWCTTGRPEGSDGAYTCITIKSSTPDSNGFYTHNQICLGRSGVNNGQMYQRLVFTNPTTGATDFGYTWKRIDNIDTAVNLAGGEKGSIPYQSEANTTVFLSAGVEGQVLKMGAGGVPVWGSDNVGDVTTDTDTKVNQTKVNNNVEYPLLLSLNSHTSGTAGEAYYDSDITINPYTNTLTIGTVEGFLLGTATLAYNLYSGGAKGSIPYQTDGVHTEFLNAGVSGQVLKMGSNGLPVWGNDNNTKVTSVGNHYTPAADDGSKLTATASGATAAWGIDVVKGITVNRDAKGHVTSVSVTSGKIPSNPNTDTKVTSVDNHYTPATNDESKLTATASGATAEWSIDVVKGVTVNRDAKGHVTGVSVTSGKIPANPNTDTKVKQTYTGSTNEFPLLLSPNGHTSGNAGEAYYDTGVTLNPSTDTLTTKIKLKESRGQWKSGRTQAAIDYKLSDGIGTTSYHSILGVKSGSGNVVNIGGYQDDFGFFGWDTSAVNNTTSDNVIPTWSFKFNTSTGDVTASGNVVATSFKEGNTFLSDKYVLKANMTDATTAEIEALFN